MNGTHDPGRHDGDPGYHDGKAKLLVRLRRIEGQIRGLQRMVERDEYCIDVLTQVAASTRALQSVAVVLLEDHLRHCVVEGSAAEPSRAEDLVAEASKAIERLVRS